MRTLVTLAVLSLGGNAHAQFRPNTVVEDENIEVHVDEWFLGIGGDFRLVVFAGPDKALSGLNSTGVEARGTELTPVIETLGPPGLWYVVDDGDHFTRDAVAADEFAAFKAGFPSPAMNTIDIGEYGEFLLGTTSYPFRDRFTDFFGWARIRLSPLGVELLDNAVAYNSEGIIVGTSTVVPEPSAIALAAFAPFALLAFRRLQRQSRLVSPR